jgi:aminoglycoside phosphotransferase
VEKFESEVLEQISEAVSDDLGKKIIFTISHTTFTSKSEIWQLQGVLENSGKAVEETFYVELQPQNLDEEMRVWIWPDDPELPQLKIVGVRQAADVLLDKFTTNFEATTVSVISYRPTKRAVFRLDSESETLWAKVVPEKDVEKISKQHEKLSANKLPVAALINWSKSGILLYESAAGIPATALTDTSEIEAVVRELSTFLANLQQVELGLPAKKFPSTHLQRYVRIVERFSPGIADLIKPEVSAIEKSFEELAGHRKNMNVHGDLHLDQFFYDRQTQKCTVIDLDNLGTGDIHAEIASLISALWFANILGNSPLSAQWREHLRPIYIDFALHEPLLRTEILASFITRLSTLPLSALPSEDKVAEIIEKVKIQPLH